MPPGETTAISSDLARELRLLVGRLGRQLRQHSTGELTPSQLSALVSIDRAGPLRLGELARLEHIAPPTLTKIVAHLEDRGLVARRVEPHDARSAVVEMTKTGTKALERVNSARTAFLDDRLGRLSDHQRRQLATALPVLACLLDDDR